MRTYEVLFILSTEVEEPEQNKIIEQLQQTLRDQGATIVKAERMGRRTLAYHIGRAKQGDYVLFVVEGKGREVAELERRLRVLDAVLRYITVRVDEDQKRAAKVKENHQKRIARKPQRGGASAGSSAPTQSASAAPASETKAE